MSTNRFITWLTSPLPQDKEIPWVNSIDGIALNHAQVSGNMGAFSIPVFVLILTSIIDSPSLCDTSGIHENISFTLGLFLLSTLYFMLTSILYSVSIKQEEKHQFMIFSCSGHIYLSAAIALFCGFYMLVLTQNIQMLSTMTQIMMIGGFLGGYFAAWIPMRMAFRLPLINGIFIFLLSSALSCFISFFYTSDISIPTNTKLTLGFSIALSIVLLVFIFNALSFTYLEIFTKGREKIIAQISAFFLSTLSLLTILITLYTDFSAGN